MTCPWSAYGCAVASAGQWDTRLSSPGDLMAWVKGCNACVLLPYTGDQIIDATMPRALHADACRNHALTPEW